MATNRTILSLLCAVALAIPAAGQDTVTLSFPNAEIGFVLDYYERLTGCNVVRNNSVVGTIDIVTPQPVSREKAIELIESAVFLNGHSIIQRKPDVVEVLGSGQNPVLEGLPVATKAEELPKNERLLTYIFKLKARKPSEMSKVFRDHTSLPSLPGHLNMVADDASRTLIVTSRSSVLRNLIRVVEKTDTARK